MGMGAVHVSTPERRDRLWLINALAVVLLTLLGAASEAVGHGDSVLGLKPLRQPVPLPAVTEPCFSDWTRCS
jgi:hypothetical protein